MPSGLLLFCTFLFSTFRYENVKQILYIFHLLIESQCRCFSQFLFHHDNMLSLNIHQDASVSMVSCLNMK